MKQILPGFVGFWFNNYYSPVVFFIFIWHFGVSHPILVLIDSYGFCQILSMCDFRIPTLAMQYFFHNSPPECKSRNQRAFFVAKGGVQRLCGKCISNDHHTCLDTKHHPLSNGQCSSNTGRLQLVVASSVPFVETGVIYQKIEFVGILLLMVKILHQLRLRQHCR